MNTNVCMYQYSQKEKKLNILLEEIVTFKHSFFIICISSEFSETPVYAQPSKNEGLVAIEGLHWYNYRGKSGQRGNP